MASQLALSCLLIFLLQKPFNDLKWVAFINWSTSKLVYQLILIIFGCIEYFSFTYYRIKLQVFFQKKIW